MAAALRVGAPFRTSARSLTAQPALPCAAALLPPACRHAAKRRTASVAAAAPPRVRPGISVVAAPGRATRSRATRLRCAAAAQPLAELAAHIPLVIPGVSTLQQDAGAALLAAAGALLVIKTCDYLAQEGLLDRVRAAAEPLQDCCLDATRRTTRREAFAPVRCCDSLRALTALPQTLTRKLVHIISGTGFLMTWLLFRCAAPRHRRRAPFAQKCRHHVSALTRLARSDSSEARYIAACVPLANGVRLAAIGLGLLRNDAAVKAISREGDPKCVCASAALRGLRLSAATQGAAARPFDLRCGYGFRYRGLLAQLTSGSDCHFAHVWR